MIEAVKKIVLETGLWGFISAAAFISFSFIIYRKCFPSISKSKRLLLSALRSLAFLSLIIFLINPVLTSLLTEEKTPVIPILVDVSESMSIQDCSGKSRIASARSFIDELLVDIKKQYDADIEIIPFSNALWKKPVSAGVIAEAAEEGTDITGTVTEAANRYRYSNTDGIILLTDGVQTDKSEFIDKINIPVYSVGFGKSQEGGYLSIEDIIYERRIYSGMKTRIEAVVAAKELGDKAKIKAELFEDGKLIDSVFVISEKGTGEYRAEFEYLPGKASSRRMEIVLKTKNKELSGRKSELFNLEVLEDKRQILYIDEQADWNMTFLRDLSHEMKKFEFDFVTWKPGQGYIKIPEYLKWQFPSSKSEIKRYDLVVISDAERMFSIAGNAVTLIEYVRGGGGVLFIADEKSPLMYERSFRLLEGIMPVKKVSVSEMYTDEYYLRISPESKTPVSVMLSECGGIYDLPPLPVYILGYSPSMGTTIPLYLEENKNGLKPLVAIEHVGEGLSGVVLGMPLWRWRLAGMEGKKIYNLFFSSLVQYLASGADVQPLEVVTSRNRYMAGEKPELSIFLGNRRVPKAIKGKLYSKEGEERLIRTFIFNPEIPTSDVFRAELPPLSPGNYRVSAREIIDSGNGFEGEAEFSVDSLSVEYIRKSMDREFLKRISERSGGKYFDSGKAEQLIRQLKPSIVKVSLIRTSSFRASIIFFMLIILFLTSEWILRKVWGLV